MTNPNERLARVETAERPRKLAPGESLADRLRRTTTEGLLSIEMVSAFAGDREMTAAEEALVLRREKERSGLFFSDLLYAISHHHFANEVAETLWREILIHKRRLTSLLGRNVRITVATLDYLSNITGELQATTLVSEANLFEMASLAMRDGMTGLFNHTSCYELLDLELRNYRRNGVGLCLLLLDIDDFKTINDHAGHQEGDRVIVALARTLVEEVRDSDICCRLGGDEFVVILRLAEDPAEGSRMAERLKARAARITSGGQPVRICVGVASADRESTSAGSLIEKADRALRDAKANGKNRVAVGWAT